MIYKVFKFSLIFLTILSCNNSDSCEEEIERFGNPILIQPEIDLWITSDTNGEISFADTMSNELDVVLSIDSTEINDVQCPEIIIERNHYTYTINGDYYLIASEQGSAFKITSKTDLQSTSLELNGNINSVGTALLDASSIDEIVIGNERYMDILLINSNRINEFRLDSVYFQLGFGLLSFKFDNVNYIRS